MLSVTRTQYLKWMKILYNQDQLNSRVYLIPESFPREKVIMEPSSSPLPLTLKEVVFERTYRGWRCLTPLQIIENAPCPALPKDIQLDIKEGYATIQELTIQVTQPKRDYRREVIKAAIDVLHRN